MLAAFSAEVVRAVALEAARKVQAHSAVQARGRGTFVQVHRAILARESGRAVAGKVVDQVNTAAAVGTRVREAVIDVHLTKATHVARSTGTAIAVSTVHARGTIAARV